MSLIVGGNVGSAYYLMRLRSMVVIALALGLVAASVGLGQETKDPAAQLGALVEKIRE